VDLHGCRDSLSHHGLLRGCRDSLSHRGLLQGCRDSLSHRGLLCGLQGSLCSSAWSTSCPPSALTVGSAGLFLSRHLTPLSQLLLVLLRFPPFPSELCDPRGATAVAGGLGLGQQQVHLGAGWHWLCRTQGKLLTASHRSHPCSCPPATETWPRKPNTDILQIKKLPSAFFQGGRGSFALFFHFFICSAYPRQQHYGSHFLFSCRF